MKMRKLPTAHEGFHAKSSTLRECTKMKEESSRATIKSETRKIRRDIWKVSFWYLDEHVRQQKPILEKR